MKVSSPILPMVAMATSLEKSEKGIGIDKNSNKYLPFSEKVVKSFQ